MISPEARKILLNNWGEKADSLHCYCEVKFIDPLSDWACYIYAINPQDEDEIECIIDAFFHGQCRWSFKDLQDTYNTDGEFPVIDPEFRRIRADLLLRKINDERRDY